MQLRLDLHGEIWPMQPTVHVAGLMDLNPTSGSSYFSEKRLPQASCVVLRSSVKSFGLCVHYTL